MDYIFVLKHVIHLVLSNKLKLKCCFVDYTKSFDTLWREVLWHKLHSLGIEGKLRNVIKSMDSQVKSSVLLNTQKSDFCITNKFTNTAIYFICKWHWRPFVSKWLQLYMDNEAVDNYIQLLMLMLVIPF